MATMLRWSPFQDLDSVERQMWRVFEGIDTNPRCAVSGEAMATESQSQSKSRAEISLLFERVIVGVDSSPASAEAARQAALLTDPEGTVTLLAAWSVPAPTLGLVSPDLSQEIEAKVYRKAAEEAVAIAKAAIAGVVTAESRVVRGFAWEELLKEVEDEQATLLAVGSHGQGRLRGILIGSTATEVVHKARCSVLVARPGGKRFPRRVVVGIDGSTQSAAAYAAAGRIADRFDSELWPVVALGGKGVDKDAVAEIVDYHHEDLPDEPVAALAAASADADLVVVGSRGLHGLKALGSVSERVAHQARCSTLIVRKIAAVEG
jgi:nucleotide-binding universal stress UspA family protein